MKMNSDKASSGMLEGGPFFPSGRFRAIGQLLNYDWLNSFAMQVALSLFL